MKIAAFVICCLALFGLTGTWLAYSGESADSTVLKATEPLLVETIVIQPLTSIVKERQFTGTVRAARRARLAFERSARLIRVLVDDGEVVAEEQVLAEIDRRQLTVQIAEVTARLSQQKAVLSELVAGPRRETIAATRAELAALNADLELNKVTSDRVENLHSRGAASAQNLDEVRLAWKSATARRDTVAMQLEELEAGTRSEQIDAQKAVVAGLEAQLERLQIDDSDSELKAPFAGMIVQRTADEGDMLSAQQPLFELLENDRLEVRIGVPSALVKELNREEYFVLSANNVEVTGHIRSVLAEVDPVTRTQAVILEIDDGQAAELADGQLVRMRFDENLAVVGFRVPMSALASGSRGLWTVYVVDTTEEGSTVRTGPDSYSKIGRISSRVVEVLHTDGSSAVIQGALYSGERVVSGGVHRVVPGQEVKFVESKLASNTTQAFVPSADSAIEEGK